MSDQVYSGTFRVEVNGKLHNSSWYGQTTAPSKQKAISNLRYRYREEFNISRAARINFYGNIKVS